jgi:hypothetical protein
MKVKDYMPTTGEKMAAFSTNFAAIVNEEFEQFAIPRADATLYVTKAADFVAKLAAATNPTTRGKMTIEAKDLAMREIVELTRKFAKQITGLMTTTNAMRTRLGLPSPAEHRTPVPAPGTAPFPKYAVDGRSVIWEMLQAANKRGKPKGVVGSMIWTYLGEVPPEDTNLWQFTMATSETKVTLPFPPSQTSDVVWVTCNWKNAKEQTGPASLPVRLILPAGGAMPSSTKMTTMKIADAA